jgi:hypothetical protein
MTVGVGVSKLRGGQPNKHPVLNPVMQILQIAWFGQQAQKWVKQGRLPSINEPAYATLS